MTAQPFVPPPYPYDRLNELKSEILERHDSIVDLSIGTPFDPPPAAVVAALSTSGAERSYPPSVGTPEFHAAVQRWLTRRFDVTVEPAQIGATVGSKEFVALLPQFMGLRSPDRDTVLYPEISYPSYAMGATLAGLRAVPVAMRADGRLDLDSIAADDARAGAAAVGEQPGQPDRASRRPRCGGRVGPGARRAGLLRRVLHRVHLGRTRADDPRARTSTVSSPSIRCRSGRTSPAPAPGSTSAIPSSSTTCARSASTPGCWCPGRCRRPAVVGARRRCPRRGAARPVPQPPRADGGGARPTGRARR